ncbi:MAG TPA: acylphosphatase [Solibacterales bacterium]|nr:acylphosphatase [Bryobacterales bacterium]
MSSSRPSEEEVQARRFVVRGRVQGVGFRDFTQRRASRLGLRGYVRNEPDGSVSAYATGTVRQLDDFEAWLRQGPPMAEVRGLESRACEVEPYESFSVR